MTNPAEDLHWFLISHATTNPKFAKSDSGRVWALREAVEAAYEEGLLAAPPEYPTPRNVVLRVQLSPVQTVTLEGSLTFE